MGFIRKIKVEYAVMKRTQSFSLYAFVLALSVHLILTLLIIILNHIKPVPIPPEEAPELPAEERFRLSLQERPEVVREAAVENTLPPVIPTARSIPRGEQMESPTDPKPTKTVSESPRAAPRTDPTPIPAEPIKPTEPLPKKAFVPNNVKPVAAIERQPMPKKEKGLYDILSKADGSAQDSPKSTTKLSDSIQRLYGDKFNELSEGEQKYILDNQEVMRRITQGVLDRYGRSRIPDSIRANDTNMIEFYLHPDGSISEIRFLKNSRLAILDDTTKEVIELAYSKYPRPNQKTLIRYRVFYSLTGY
jgi:periplasmic protein TonB